MVLAPTKSHQAKLKREQCWRNFVFAYLFSFTHTKKTPSINSSADAWPHEPIMQPNFLVDVKRNDGSTKAFAPGRRLFLPMQYKALRQRVQYPPPCSIIFYIHLFFRVFFRLTSFHSLPNPREIENLDKTVVSLLFFYLIPRLAPCCVFHFLYVRSFVSKRQYSAHLPLPL